MIVGAASPQPPGTGQALGELGQGRAGRGCPGPSCQQHIHPAFFLYNPSALGCFSESGQNFKVCAYELHIGYEIAHAHT